MTDSSVLLVVDRRFVEFEGDIYTEGPIGPETGDRYLHWFDRVIVAGRRGELGLRTTRGLTRVAAPGLTITYLPDLSGLRCRARSVGVARRRLRALFDDVDCVIARLPSELGLEAANLALQARKPLALDVAGCVLDGMRAHGSLAGKVYAPIAYQRMRSVVGRTKWVSFVTRDFLQGRYPVSPEAHTVACSNVEIPEPAPHVLDTRLHRIDSEPRPLIFGTIGSLYGSFKGIQHAFEALAQAAPFLPDFRYRILGGGNTAAWMELAAQHGLQEKVEFDGVLPAGAAVLRWLDDVDIYLQPSLREGLPRALIEAMSRGCPAIASDVAGIPELLPSALLHGPGDVNHLAKLITTLASSRAELKSRAASNLEVARRYSAERLWSIRSAFWSAFSASTGRNTAGKADMHQAHRGTLHPSA